MITSFGPTTLSITLGNNSLSLCIQLTQTATRGQFTVYFGSPGQGTCSNVTLTNSVGTVTLNEDNSIASFSSSNNRVNGHTWTAMGGSFSTNGTGSGSVTTANNPTATSGTWAAGGTGMPVPRPHHAKGGAA